MTPKAAVYPERGDNSILKNRFYVLLAFAVLLPLAAAAGSTGTVFGQSCGVEVGYVDASAQYSGNYYGQSNPYNIQLIVPISMSCPNSGNTLWAIGTVYDTFTGNSVGSSNAALSLNNGNYFGQLVVPLPTSVVGHQLQVQIQVYNSYNNGQYGGLVATSSPTVTVNPSGYYYPSTGGYSNYNGYPNGYYNGYYYYYYGAPSYYNGYPSYYYNNGYPYYYYNNNGYPYYYYYSGNQYSYPYYYYHYGTSCHYGQGYYSGCDWYYHHHR